MTNRRDHHRSHGDEDGTGRVDPWEALGSSSSAEDFWGDTPDWSAPASTAQRTGRSRIGSDVDDIVDPTPIGTPRAADAGSNGPARSGGLVGSIGRAWDQLLGGGADTTRGHRRVDAESLPPEDDDLPIAATPRRRTVATGAVPTVAPDAAPAPAPRTPVEEVEHQWVAEAAAAPDRPSPIDPLLTRLGALIIVTALVVPLLLSIVSSDGAGDSDAVGSESAAAELVPVPAPTLSDFDQSVTTTTVLDPASLPPAVPVNTDAPAAATSAELDDEAGVESTDLSSADASDEPSMSAQSNSISDEPDLDALDAAAAAAETAARVDPPVCPVEYTVVEGDFWLRLADAAGVPLADLLAVNGATVNTPLFPGAEICLPEGATTPAPPVTTPPTTQAPPSTAAATTTTEVPTTTAAPAAEPPGPDDIKQIIRDVWPDELEDRALEIAYRESRFVPTAKNFCCYGLFQIYWEVHDVWLDDIGITSASQLYDPETNARAAYALYERAGGWGPWAL